MKTVQIGEGEIKVIQFETLAEIELIFSESEIVKNFNFGYRFYYIAACNALQSSNLGSK